MNLKEMAKKLRQLGFCLASDFQLNPLEDAAMNADAASFTEDLRWLADALHAHYERDMEIAEKIRNAARETDHWIKFGYGASFKQISLNLNQLANKLEGKEVSNDLVAEDNQ